MKAKMPNACPRGPYRRTYTAQKINRTKAASAATRKGASAPPASRTADTSGTAAPTTNT